MRKLPATTWPRSGSNDSELASSGGVIRPPRAGQDDNSGGKRRYSPPAWNRCKSSWPAPRAARASLCASTRTPPAITGTVPNATSSRSPIRQASRRRPWPPRRPRDRSAAATRRVGGGGMELTVPEHLAGERLDRAMAALAPALGRGEARRLIDAGAVFVDGRRTRICSRPVRTGERITWQEGRGHHLHAPAAGAGGVEPRVVLEHPDLWIVDKP